jgi:oxygen-dependent protoporphyrinogen oxidase
MKIAILGGGISGLTAAWRLSHLLPKAQITLYEKSNRLGGYLETSETNGVLFEKGARTFRTTNCPSLLTLIREVGLGDDLIFSKPQKRYLWHKNALRSMGALFAPHFWRLFLEPFVREAKEEETVYSFFKRRLGKKAADLFADPFCLGVFAGDSRSLSMSACFPQIAKQRSLLFTPPSTLFTLQNGMQSLIDTLSQKLSIEIRLNTEITDLDSLEADAIFSALPASSLARLIPSFPKIESASLSLVNLGFLKKFRFPHEGYGYLAPKEPLMGMIWDSNIFPQQNGIRLTAMIRAEVSNPEAAALHALNTHLKINQSPDFIQTTRINQAIPQLVLGHVDRFAAWERTLSKKIHILGNFIIGPSVEQCVVRAEQKISIFTKSFL